MNLFNLLPFSLLLAGAAALLPLKQELESRQGADVRVESNIPLVVTNRCSDTIWPGIATQTGTGPESLGFELSPGSTRNQTVALDWIGRVWGRTNCTFNEEGAGTCGTGDCGGNITCSATGAPATLAEFNLRGYMNQSYYDISLVDGYNLPLAIQVIPDTNDPSGLLPNATNPSCVGSVEGLASNSFNPYKTGQQDFLGTSSSAPLPFERGRSSRDVATWCPYDLQQNPLEDIGDLTCPCFVGADVKRPKFNPCLSACAKYNKPAFCCTGSHESRRKCKPNYYSKAAKVVCPDAYGYAYDDASSTFSIPTGSGFEVVFCPGGRSTTILKVRAGGSSSSASGPTAKVSGALGVLALVVWFARLLV